MEILRFLMPCLIFGFTSTLCPPISAPLSLIFSLGLFSLGVLALLSAPSLALKRYPAEDRPC